jgi:transposase
VPSECFEYFRGFAKELLHNNMKQVIIEPVSKLDII